MPSRLYIGRKQEERASLRVSHRAEVALVQGEDVYAYSGLAEI
jgi:hypothetical protein